MRYVDLTTAPIPPPPPPWSTPSAGSSTAAPACRWTGRGSPCSMPIPASRPGFRRRRGQHLPVTVVSGGFGYRRRRRAYTISRPAITAFPMVLPGHYRLQVEPPAGYAFPSTVATADLQACRRPPSPSACPAPAARPSPSIPVPSSGSISRSTRLRRRPVAEKTAGKTVVGGRAISSPTGCGWKIRMTAASPPK